MKHIHADLIRLYAEDAQNTEEPWKLWEYYDKDCGDWQHCQLHPCWIKTNKYRRKLKCININGYDVPEPCRIKPESDTKYYFPLLSKQDNIDWLTWEGDDIDYQILNNGLLHLTEDAAVLHAEALISFTKV